MNYDPRQASSPLPKSPGVEPGSRPAARSKKKRSGSEKRRRGVVNKFRSTPEERAEMNANAAAVGLSFGSYMRSLACAHPTTRPVHRLTPDMKLVKKLLAEVSRLGGNIYQLVRAMNFGGIPESDEMDAAGKEARALLAEAFKALGM
jgi:hypothetical protein